MNTQPNASGRPLLIVGVPTIIALWFLNSYALRYFAMDPDRLGLFWPHRDWLHAHIAGGTIALLLGPIQLWLGSDRGFKSLHRVLGVGYVMAVAIGGPAALYLSVKTGFGWVFGLGFAAMSIAWLTTTTFATIAIYRRMLDQHREWMIRSYVVTFGFVIFRALVEILGIVNAGTSLERMVAASWLSWSVPLFLTEAILQGRKIFAPRAPREVAELAVLAIPDAKNGEQAF